jgi:hypothetical protein
MAAGLHRREPEYLVVGNAVFVDRRQADGTRMVDVLFLPAVLPGPEDPDRFLIAPWSDPCDACGGTAIVVGGDGGQQGPCGACHGTGVTVFAFHHDDSPVCEALPPTIAAPYAWAHPELAP